MVKITGYKLIKLSAKEKEHALHYNAEFLVVAAETLGHSAIRQITGFFVYFADKLRRSLASVLGAIEGIWKGEPIKTFLPIFIRTEMSLRTQNSTIVVIARAWKNRSIL